MKSFFLPEAIDIIIDLIAYTPIIRQTIFSIEILFQ